VPCDIPRKVGNWLVTATDFTCWGYVAPRPPETTQDCSIARTGEEIVANGPGARRTEHRNRNVLPVREDSDNVVATQANFRKKRKLSAAAEANTAQRRERVAQ